MPRAAKPLLVDIKRFVVAAGLLALMPGVSSGATIAAPSERGAQASWIRLERVRYVIEVTERTQVAVVAGAGLDARREVAGEVLAAIELCDGSLSSCDRGQTWSGVLGSGLTNGVAFDADPALGTASLTGWLRDVETGTPCLFTVRWRASEAPDASSTDLIVDPMGPAAAAGLSFSRASSAAVDAACWLTRSSPEFVAGEGSLSASYAAAASAAS